MTYNKYMNLYILHTFFVCQVVFEILYVCVSMLCYVSVILGFQVIRLHFSGIYKPIEYWQLKDQNTPLDRHPVSSVFTLKEMEEATNSFSDENLVGKGGFGRVYKGTLRSGGVWFSFYFHHGSKNHNLIIEFVILYTKYPT